MRVGWWMVAVLVLLPLGARAAEAPVMLGTNPSECEISRALLGVAPPSCPPAPVVIPAAPAIPVAPPPAASRPAPTVAAPVASAAPAGVERRAAFLINFDFGSTRIRPESQAVLDRVAAVMAAPESGAARFRIVGHTDGVGSDAGNLDLSRRRAAAVKDYLVRRHRVAAGRLEATGMGKREPLDRTNPRAAENRRVEIVTLGG
jgi:outer membrane protein OmpA-like peptidoglycan-associated protein